MRAQVVALLTLWLLPVDPWQGEEQLQALDGKPAVVELPGIEDLGKPLRSLPPGWGYLQATAETVSFLTRHPVAGNLRDGLRVTRAVYRRVNDSQYRFEGFKDEYLPSDAWKNWENEDADKIAKCREWSTQAREMTADELGEIDALLDEQLGGE